MTKTIGCTQNDTPYGESLPICLLGADVVSSLPNMKRREVGMIIREMIERYEMTFKGIDEILLYTKMNLSQLTDVAQLVPLLPYRKSKFQETPGISSVSIKRPHKQSELRNERQLWTFRQAPASPALIGNMVGTVATIF